MATKRGILVSILLIFGGFFAYLSIKINSVLPLETNMTWMLAVGLILFTYGLLLQQSENAYKWFEERIGITSYWLSISHWQVLLLTISPVFTILSAVTSGVQPKMLNSYLAIFSWLTGIVSLLIGGYVWDEKKPNFSKQTILIMGTITYIAFVLRGIGTGSFPVILTGDEGSAGISAVNFISGEWDNIFITSWFSFPSFFSFIQSLSIRSLGQTTEALRIVSAIAGALTVTATYLCGKAMFGERVGILASATLTALHFHIHFSRLGLNNIWDGLGFTVTIGALWYGWEKNKRLAYLLAGLALGFSQYFYVSSRGLLGIVVVCIALAFLFQRKRFYQSAPGIIIMSAVALAVLFPLFRYYISEPNHFVAPFERVSTMNSNFDTSVNTIWEQIVIGLQAYTYVPSRNWYKPEAPILRPIFSTFFYIGSIFLLLNKKDSRFILLAFWLLLFGFIGGLSESPPAAQRYVAATPACALIVGFGLSKFTGVFENIWGNYSRTITSLGYMIIIIGMVSDLSFYFIDYRGVDIIENTNSNGKVAQQLANDLKDEPTGTQVVFLHNPRMGYYSFSSILYLAPQVEGIDAPEDWRDFDQTKLNSQKVFFVFLAEDINMFKTVQEEFPGGSFTFRREWDGETLFWLYEYEKR
jgi:4-amino-4-deoxy-L-arabinose transferase-like glycosyltransferase